MSSSAHALEAPLTHMFSDPISGASGVIVIDSLALGPAAGGCRLWTYDNEDAMVTDAKRLARGMSYKNAMAELPFGGGKAVLNKPNGAFDRAGYYRALGDAIAALDGQYITAEDVGTTMADMAVVSSRTRFVSGLSPQDGMAGGDPSEMTAIGVFEAMRAVAEKHLGLPLDKATVAIQGTGSVGSRLAHLLHTAGAKLIIADVFPEKAATLASELRAQHVNAEEIIGAAVDIFAPCALGAILNADSIPNIKAKLVCGAANNQLAVEADGAALRDRGIIYVPDYVVNAGGIINVAAEFLGEPHDKVHDRVMKIASRVLTVLDEADARQLPTNIIADEMAQRIISASR